MPELVKGYYSKRDDKGRVISCEEKELYKGDLHDAVQKFPHEWSHKPLKVDGSADTESVAPAKPGKRKQQRRRKRSGETTQPPTSDGTTTSSTTDSQGQSS